MIALGLNSPISFMSPPAAPTANSSSGAISAGSDVIDQLSPGTPQWLKAAEITLANTPHVRRKASSNDDALAKVNEGEELAPPAPAMVLRPTTPVVRARPITPVVRVAASAVRPVTPAPAPNGRKQLASVFLLGVAVAGVLTGLGWTLASNPTQPAAPAALAAAIAQSDVGHTTATATATKMTAHSMTSEGSAHALTTTRFAWHAERAYLYARSFCYLAEVDGHHEPDVDRAAVTPPARVGRERDDGPIAAAASAATAAPPPVSSRGKPQQRPQLQRLWWRLQTSQM